jgi:hypothetical protein
MAAYLCMYTQDPLKVTYRPLVTWYPAKLGGFPVLQYEKTAVNFADS